MDKSQIKAMLSDESKLKEMIKAGFQKRDTAKKGFITWEDFNDGVLKQMAAIGLDTKLAPPEVMDRVKGVAAPDGKVTEDTGLKAVQALVKIAIETGNL